MELSSKGKITLAVAFFMGTSQPVPMAFQ